MGLARCLASAETESGQLALGFGFPLESAARRLAASVRLVQPVRHPSASRSQSCPKWMSQKKSLEEQSTALSAGRANWLEPFQNWILTARNAGEIAVKGSPQEKKVLAQKVFGSNLVLDCKKARDSCANRGRSSSKTLRLVEWCPRQDLNLSGTAKTKGKSKGDAQRDAQELDSPCHALSLVVAAWPKLPPSLQQAILSIVNSVVEGQWAKK